MLQSTLQEHEAQELRLEKTSEISVLKSQTYDLETQIENLEVFTIIKDDSITYSLKEKEQLIASLESQKRRNRSLAEQLESEKRYYRKEKKEFRKEMCKANERRKKYVKESKCLTRQQRSNASEIPRALIEVRQEHKKLEEMLKSKTRIIFSICVKFQRMKTHKDYIQNRLLELQHELCNITQYLEHLLQDSKNEMHIVSTHCFSGHIHKKDALFLQISQRNHLLLLENLALKSEYQKLEKTSVRKKTKLAKQGKMLNDESSSDAAVLDVVTAYAPTITASMLAREDKDSSLTLSRTWSSPALADLHPTQPNDPCCSETLTTS